MDLFISFTGEAVPYGPEIIIVSCAIGGWGGTPDDSQLPQYMYIDYVRVYKKTPNLVLNPGFECDFEGWIDNSNTAITTSVVHSGSKALKIGPGAGGRYQRITSGVAPGKAYTFSVYGRGEGEYWTAGLNFLDSNNNNLGNSYYVSFQSESSYTKKEITTPPAPAGTAKIEVWLWKNAGSYNAYADDISLTEN